MAEDFEKQIYRFPSFFDRLQEEGALNAWDAVDYDVESETEIEGIIYHHRGVQVPSHDAKFIWEPEGGYSMPTFSVELGTVGPRSAWAVFDATLDWDVYLVLFEGGAVVAWMTDEEYETDEAERFRSKAAAIEAGSFSFGTFFRFGPDWVERDEWAKQSTAPAMIQLGDGRVLKPETSSEFYGTAGAVPVEFRPGKDEDPPAYLGLVDSHLSADDDR